MHQDPADGNLLRYWDGTQWTEQTQPKPSALPVRVTGPCAFIGPRTLRCSGTSTWSRSLTSTTQW
ncbi:DUF2510 domain-containing protein [Rhodococcus opacus]|uniref:DUF2510 domain-containing protein n=1 Tax=Rhodococcus opacus TaxID=37919 RepID=UPI001FFA12D7|nr:DUF2510 domain-containing protein [Rhodococcus opacus]MDX5969880.1 DUF2510 domain-containing protein [Rhodococcus opacus]